MEKPFVSVVISTHNRQNYIKRAIESIFYQTYKNFEVIIVDDGSGDETPKILSELLKKDSRIKIIRNKKNLGFVKSLNLGVGQAKGKYLARLDDDDFWSDKAKLEKQIDFFEKNLDYVLIGGGMVKINEENREIGRYLFPEKDEEIRKTLLVDNLFAHSSVVFRKDAWEKVGGYEEEVDFFADLDLWLKLGKVGKFYNFQDYFICYLEDKENRADYKIRRKLRLNIKLRKKYQNDYPGFWKAFFVYLGNYFYSFFPFRKKLRPIFFLFRKIIFGPPAYKKF